MPPERISTAILCPSCGHGPRPGSIFGRFADLHAITSYVESGDTAPPLRCRCTSCDGDFEVSARQVGALFIEHRQHLLLDNIAGILRRAPRYQ